MPLRIFKTRFYREVTADEFEQVMIDLRDSGLKFLLRQANEAYFQIFGVDAPASGTERDAALTDRVRYAAGDLAPSEDWSQLIYVGLRLERKGPPTLGRRNREYTRHLELGCISTTGDSTELARAQDLAERKLGEGQEQEESRWRVRVWSAKQFEELSETGQAKKSDFSEADIAAASLLEDAAVLELATTVKRAGGMLLTDFREQELPKLNPQAADRLLESPLVERTKVLICRKTSKMLARVPSSETVSELSRLGATCASCSRPFGEEKIDELVVPTDRAKELIDHSTWMVALLADRLRAIGVFEDQILFEFQEGTHEVDALVDLEGELIMFELKDREFGMGDAYALSGRLAKYKADYTVIITTKKVAPEVREYFQQIKPETTLSYVEGLSNLTPLLTQLALAIRSEKCISVLRRFEILTLGNQFAEVIGRRLGLASPKKQRFRWADSILSSMEEE